MYKQSETQIAESLAEVRHSNTLCFTLVEKKAPLAAVNVEGETPADIARGASPERKNHHLIFTFHEITSYQKQRHLSLMHFRDWTTVSHAWGTPSAKLTALTVLLVGETYRRKLLPRLPMDVWYRILNCIPRHALRQGDCAPEGEQEAMVTYMNILREAKLTTGAAAAAAAAAATGT